MATSTPAPRRRGPSRDEVVTVAVAAALLPVRLAVAATRTTLALGELTAPDGPVRRPGGYADLALRVIGDRGYVQQLTEMLTDDDGPLRLASRVTELAAPDRPLGRMLARDGVLDRLLAEDGPVARLVAPGGPLDRISGPGGLLERVLEPGGTFDRLSAPGGVLEQVLKPGGLADRMLTDDAFLDKLLADGGTLDQLIELGSTLESIQPRLEELARLIPSLASSADDLGRAVGPLGDLAGRLPLIGRRALDSSS